MMPVLFLLLFLGALLGQGPAAAATLLSGDISPQISRNPFTPPVSLNAPPNQTPGASLNTMQTEAHSLALRAILVGGGNSLANINGVILSRGESIDGYTLMAINEFEVVLARDGQRVTLSLVSKNQPLMPAANGTP